MPLPKVDDLTDEEFETRFREKTLDPTLFDHRAHLRLAYIHIQKYGMEQAKENLCSQIRAFDQTFGDGTKYDPELTLAAVRVMAGLLESANPGDFTSFLNHHPALLNDFKSLL